jgi:hypothetical protein
MTTETHSRRIPKSVFTYFLRLLVSPCGFCSQPCGEQIENSMYGEIAAAATCFKSAFAEGLDLLYL